MTIPSMTSYLSYCNVVDLTILWGELMLSPVLMTRLDSDANNAALRENAAKQVIIVTVQLWSNHSSFFAACLRSASASSGRSAERDAPSAV